MKININGELTVKWNKVITAIDTVNDTTNGIMTSVMKKKLDGIEEGSQVNTITGIKCSNETEYRIGQINITNDNIGLNDVDNTSDINKPVSTATRTAIDEAYANSNRYTDKKISDL